MTYRTRYDEMLEQAREYHEKYPLVWELFTKYTLELIRRGFRHYSCRAIFERIRWETDQASVDGQSTFKVNNNHSSFYARWFMEVFPQYNGFFRIRIQLSKEAEALELPELGPGDFDGHNPKAPRGAL